MRARVVGPFVAMVALVVASSGVPSGAERSNPADDLLDRAGEAIRRHEFQATVRVWWRDASGPHSVDVSVTAVDGGLRLADGRLVAAAGRAWMRGSDQQWTTLWADTRDPRSPSVGAKYSVRTSSGPTIVGRRTRVLVIRKGRTIVERLAFDRSVGLVLLRERFDRDGSLSSRVEFVELSKVRDRHGELAVPKVGVPTSERMQTAKADAPQVLGDGFVLVQARRMSQGQTQYRYSDGIFELSVFSQPGEIDWSALPEGGSPRRYGSVHTRRYRTAAGTVIVWQSQKRTLTCVTDAPTSDEFGIVQDLSRDNDSSWTGVVRFVTAPFSWN